MIAGNGTQEKNAHQKVRQLGISQKVTFTCVPYDKLHTLYKKADIFIAPSRDTHTWHEQFGYTFAEAMAAGLPILTTDAGAIPEVVGNAALIVPQKNTEQLSTHLIKLTETQALRESLGKKARTRAEKLFDSHKVAKELKDIYTSLI